MKLDVTRQNDDKTHVYCVACHSEDVERHRVDGRTQYFCKSCNKDYDRWIKIDPSIVWWVDEDSTYWHESAGMFVRNPEGKFLFFQRDVFPFSLTVPSGHVDAGESPETAAHRELMEEAGISGDLRLIASDDVLGDQCSRGADDHKWHAYLSTITESDLDVSIREEGHSPRWLTLDEAIKSSLTVPVEYFIQKHRKALLNSV